MAAKEKKLDCGVYRIFCKETGKSYIGSSKEIVRRLRYHKWSLRKGHHHSFLLQRAFSKYGESAFDFSVLIYCEEKDRIWFEQRALDGYLSYDPSHGYNRSSVASKAVYERDPETGRKISAARKGKPIYRNNPEKHAELMARVARGSDHHFYGKKHTEESRRKMSESLKGRSVWNKGVPSDRKGVPRTEKDRKAVTDARRAAVTSGMSIDKARQIRSLFADGMRQIDIARELSVSAGIVYRVIAEKAWREN